MLRLSYSLKSIIPSPSSKVPMTKTSNNDYNIKTGDQFEHVLQFNAITRESSSQSREEKPQKCLKGEIPVKGGLYGFK